MLNREALLVNWAQYVAEAALKGVITGKPCAVTQIGTVNGPRAGALEIMAGLDAGKLLRALSSNQAAQARAFIPWRFTGEPQVYMASRSLRLEAGWPGDLANSDVALGSLSPYPKGDGRWVVGLNEHGQTVIASVNLDRTPHWLVSGATGAGKTVALRSALAQFAADVDNRLVVVDGKYGASFPGLSLRGMVGPAARVPEDWERALVWAATEMQKRYLTDPAGRLIVVVDEVQEIIRASSLAAEAIRRLVTLGRDAKVHCLLATQHPVVKTLGGPTVTRNLVGRLALHVTDSSASQVAVGSNYPRADKLLGCGDAYVVTPSATFRVQVAYVTSRDLESVKGEPELEDWPNCGNLDESPGRGRPSPWPRPGEIGVSLISALWDEGRPKLKKRLVEAGLTRPGSERARNLLSLGRESLGWLNEQGWRLGAPCQVINLLGAGDR